MKKQEKKTVCTYCLTECDDLTDDHIFPRTWYPKTTPPTVEKWVVPACKECNNHYGAVEHKLLVRMGLCLDADSPESIGIQQKALRSIDPKLGDNERDKNARLSLRKEILGDTFATSDPNPVGLLPNFGSQTGMEYGGSYRVIQIPADLIDELARKFVRALIYKLENGLLVTPSQNIEIYHAEDKAVESVIATIERLGHTICRGPGIKIQGAVGDLRTIGALFRIVVWKRWTIYAVIHPLVS